jgi:hypothetical protein
MTPLFLVKQAKINQAFGDSLKDSRLHMELKRPFKNVMNFFLL